MIAEDAVRQAVERFYEAVNQLQQGDPESMLALWSHAEDITHMGPRGGQQRGWAAVRTYWEDAARLAATSPGEVIAAPGDQVIRVVGDLAYVCGAERVRVTRDGQMTELAPRATNIFRHEAGQWRLVHRQAENP